MQAQHLGERAEAYAVLSRAFSSEPDAAAVSAFIGFDWDLLLGHSPLAGLFEDSEATSPRNRSEFGRMFLGPKKLIAPPYESVYRSGTRRMGGEHADRMRDLYLSSGIRRDGSTNEPDDFIGFELQFACYLLTAAHMAYESGDESSLEFALQRYHELLFDHLVIWVPAFCEDILDAEPLPFMAACARALAALVKLEEKCRDSDIPSYDAEQPNPDKCAVNATKCDTYELSLSNHAATSTR